MMVPRPAGARVVAIYCYEYGQTWWKNWGPSSLGRGVGGSEEAVIFMARELSRRGFWVEVYADPPQQEWGLHYPPDYSSSSSNSGVGGVSGSGQGFGGASVWYPYWAYDSGGGAAAAAAPYAFVAWRYHVSLVLAKNSPRRYLWLQDVPPSNPSPFTPWWLRQVQLDAFFVLSSFHGSLLQLQTEQQQQQQQRGEGDGGGGGARGEGWGRVVVSRNALDPGPDYFVYAPPHSNSSSSDSSPVDVDVDVCSGVPNCPSRFVYASAPNRGLESVLLAWPYIRAHLPDATLEVYYGFSPAFETHARQHFWPAPPHRPLSVPGPQGKAVGGALWERMEQAAAEAAEDARFVGEAVAGNAAYVAWRARMEVLLQQPGVRYIGMVSHPTLALALAQASFSLYPTTFPETGCVALMKAMAMGAIPITTRFPDSTLPELTGRFDLGPARGWEGESLVLPHPSWLLDWARATVSAAAQAGARLSAEAQQQQGEGGEGQGLPQLVLVTPSGDDEAAQVAAAVAADPAVDPATALAAEAAGSGKEAQASLELHRAAMRTWARRHFRWSAVAEIWDEEFSNVV